MEQGKQGIESIYFSGKTNVQKVQLRWCGILQDSDIKVVQHYISYLLRVCSTHGGLFFRYCTSIWYSSLSRTTLLQSLKMSGESWSNDSPARFSWSFFSPNFLESQRLLRLSSLWGCFLLVEFSRFFLFTISHYPSLFSSPSPPRSRGSRHLKVPPATSNNVSVWVETRTTTTSPANFVFRPCRTLL